MITWNREKIAALDDAKLDRLRVNAIAKNAIELVTMCDEEISSRPIKTSRRASASALGLDKQRNAEAEAAAQLTDFAATISSRYDLTAATAKRLSAGTKGFRAVELLGKNGTAKIGGMKLKGFLAIDLYISYRCKNDRASLGYVMLKGCPIEEGRWIATATKSILPEGQPIIDQIVGLSELVGAYEGVTGYALSDFNQAAEIFERAIMAICQQIPAE
jgi:hypothetical protein